MIRLPWTPLAALLLLTCGPLLANASAGEEASGGDLAEIQALEARGGHAVLPRLTTLIEEGSVEVRVAALGAAATVGVRSKAIAEATRKVLADAVHPRFGPVAALLRTAALEALGRVGDGDDLPALIDGLRAPEEEVRAAALRGLHALTGRRTPGIHARWVRWWRVEQPRMKAGVRRAVRHLAEADERTQEMPRKLIARDGWSLVDYVRDAAKDWLSAGDRRVRAQAFFLVAEYRLADLVPDVESALPYLTNVDGEDGLRAVRALGIAPDALAPYWKRRLDDDG